MKAGLTFNHAASEIVNRPDWLGSFLPFEPSIKSLLEYSFVGVFSSQSNISYNAFLWTMSIELVGSMLVFFYLYACPRLRFPGAILLVLAALCLLFQLNYAGFFIGVYLGRLRVEKFFERAQGNRFASSLTIAAPVFIIVAVRHFSYDPIVVNTIVASLLVFLVYANKSATRFFSSGFSKLLGRLSFPLYLSQFSVIVSFTSYAIVLAHRSNHLDKPHILLIIALSLALIFLVAAALTIVERYTLRLCELISRRLLTTTGRSDSAFRGASKSLSG
jgi:peptidoglycan/LPS O-acetylase OafA/YrhL